MLKGASIALQPDSLFRIAVRFFLLLILFSGGYYVEKKVTGQIIDIPYTRLVTLASAWVGQVVMPIPVTMRGDIILGSGNTAVVVRAGCNGLEAIFLMLAGILAYPTSWRRRGQALSLYLPTLFILNLLRVLLLLFVMARYPQYIDVFHYQVGQAVLVVFVFAFWVHYVHWTKS